MPKPFIFCLILICSYPGFAQGVDITLRGAYTQGGMVIGKIENSGDQLNESSLNGITIRLNGEAIKKSESGHFVFGFGRDSALEQELTWYTGNELVGQRTIKLEKREYNIQRIEGVPQQMVTPSPDKLARIRSDASLVRKARETDLNDLHFLTGFIAPAKGPITGVYGSQRVFNGTPKRPHFGLDIAGPVGTKIIAPAPGKVTLVHNDMYYSGGTLIIDHGFGISSTFIHLNKIVVEEGNQVKQGQKIAEMGATGRVTGPHLDWRMNWFGVRIDPKLVMEELGQ